MGSRTSIVDPINCLLIVIAALSAWCEPFLTFVLAYAVLGPLHYLTELSWLHDRDYYLPKRSDRNILVGLCTVGFLASLAATIEWGIPDDRGLLLALWGQRIAIVSGVLAFFLALLLMTPRARSNLFWIAPLMTIGGLLACFTEAEYPLFLIFGIFLPTLIHVSVFTLVFMLNGVAKNRNVWGGVSVLLYCVAVAALLKSAAPLYAEQPLFGRQFVQSFGFLSSALLSIFGDAVTSESELLHSERAIAATRLIAFAYLYHYLNWFSKTSIISWHTVSRLRGTALIGIWGACIGIFVYDFKTGLVVSGGLSLLHVFMEFPLNWRSLEAFLGGIQRVSSPNKPS